MLSDLILTSAIDRSERHHLHAVRQGPRPGRRGAGRGAAEERQQRAAAQRDRRGQCVCRRTKCEPLRVRCWVRAGVATGGGAARALCICDCTSVRSRRPLPPPPLSPLPRRLARRYYGPHNVCDGMFWNLVDGIARHATATTSALGGA